MSSDGLRAPADANLLVPRSSLQKILASIHRGNCSLVIGPRYRGKSKLVRRAAEDLAQTRFYQVAYASMHEVSQADSQQFYRTLIDTICSQTGDRTSIYSDVESASDFQNAMLELIGRCENNLLLLIDDLEIAPPNLIALLLGAIRSVFTTVANQSGTRFQAIISGSVNLHQLALRGISHFASISDLILVDDMTLEEARIYAAGLFSQESIQVPDRALDAFLVQTSSDPVLIRFLAHACIAQIWSLNEPGLYADMLPDAVERVLRHKPNYEIAEALSQIEGDPELLSCLLEILQKGEMHLSELPLRMADHPNALDLSGVFHHKEGAYSIKAPLWQSLLEKHFSSAHCGRLYAIAGLWSRAIEQYEKAIHRDKIDKKSDLFGATINGMQASEDDREALAVLAQGLHACYPNCEIGIYLRTESVLGLEHFFPGKKTGSESLRQEIQLDEHTSPEVEALQGPDYSKISSRQKVRFLIPLRVHSGAPAIGLVSYCGGLSMLDQHEQREEVLQFVSFLHQAARAIESRRKYSTVLRDARSHSQTLEGLDHILTSVLNHLDLPEEVIFRLLLAGLTANEGLGFNRAALFLLNDQGWLVGTMGVGHLSWEEADADWKSLPFTSIDELMEALMVLNYQYTSLHAVVQSLRFPIQNEDLFGKVHQDGMARRGHQPANLPASLVMAIDPAKEFAIAPLTAGTRRLGLVYVDNKYTRKPIDQFQMASLTSFLTQATLVMQMARSLQAERHQSQILSRLLEIEKTINNKITQSMQEVLEEIARSARGLMAASSTVAFNLKHVASVEQEGYFEADRMARVHTRVAPLGVPNSKEGMLKWVLADGQINVTDIQFASSFPDGYHPEQSKFLKKEGVRSFVGLRLGTREQPVGVLFINWYSPHQLSKNELTILEVFAAFATAAISSAGKHEQMRQELQQRTQELQTLSNLIESSLDSRPEGELENLILETLTSLREQTRARIVRLFVLESGDHLREYRLARRGFLASRVLTRLENGPVITALDSGIVVTERFVQTPPGRQAQNGNTASSRVRSAIPLLKGKNRLGAFYLETLEEDFSLVDDEKRDFIRYLADRLAITFHQTEIYNALRRLLDISIMLKPEFELKQVIRELVEGAVQAMPSISAVTAYFMNQQSRQFEIGHMVGVHSRDFARRYTLIPGSIVDRLIKRDGPVFADFTEQDVDLYSPFAIREGIKSTAAMPLEIGKEMVGYIFFNFRRQYYFDETRKGWLRLFAQIATIAIHRTNLQIDLARRQSRLEAVAQITPLIARANPDITEVYRTVLREILKAIPRANNACIVERRPSRKARQAGYYRLVLIPPSQEFYHATRASTIHGYEMGKDQRQGIASRVIENQKAEIIPDVSVDLAYFRAVNGTRSEMCIPIHGTEQAIVLESKLHDAFTVEDQQLVEMLATHVAVALNNENLFRTQRERQTRERVAQMATGIIHDVNNLISNIPDVVGELRTELKGSRNDEAIEEYLHDLQISATSTHRISSRLRDFVIGMEFKPVVSDLGQLMKKVIKDLTSSKPAHVKIEDFQPAALPKIKVDPLWVEQLFSNLLHNAFEAIPSSREGFVRVNAWLDQKKIWIAVEDNGSGIPQGLLDKIFQPGFTTKGSPARLHGIGLYFCQQIVLAHHGEIKVQSMPGETTFTVAFPVGAVFKEGTSFVY